MLIQKPYNIFKAFITLCLWILPFSFFLPNANAEKVYGHFEPPLFKIGRMALEFELDRFGAGENFSSNGKANADLTGDFEAFNSYLGVENDLSRKTSVSAGVLLGMASSSKQGVSRRNSKIKGLQFGISRVLPVSGKDLKFIADFKYFQSFHKNSFGSDQVSLGDGTSFVQTGLWVGTENFKHGRVWVFGGFHWPLRGLAKNFVFQARPEFKYKKGRIGLGLEGQFPIIDDKDLDEPTNRLRLIDEYNGGSFYYQPLNAEFIGLSAWYGFEPVPLTEIRLGVANRLTGRSAAKGFVLFVTAEFSFSVTRTGIEYPYNVVGSGKARVKRERGIRKLKDYAGQPRGKKRRKKSKK